MRLEVTRKSHLAICAIVELSNAPDRVKTADLAERLDATPAFLAQVLGELVRQRWVQSNPGPTGGYQLLIDTGELSILDVIEALEGPTEAEDCVVANAPCGTDGYCALHDGWTEARSVLIEHLRSTTIERVGAKQSGETGVSLSDRRARTKPPDE